MHYRLQYRQHNYPCYFAMGGAVCAICARVNGSLFLWSLDEQGAPTRYSRGTSLSDSWLWLLSCVVFLATSAALVAMERNSRRTKKLGATSTDGLERLDERCHGLCCFCSLVSKHSDKVITFIGNALVWTGALALKRTIDATVSP